MTIESILLLSMNLRRPNCASHYFIFSILWCYIPLVEKKSACLLGAATQHRREKKIEFQSNQCRMKERQTNQLSLYCWQCFACALTAVRKEFLCEKWLKKKKKTVNKATICVTGLRYFLRKKKICSSSVTHRCSQHMHVAYIQYIHNYRKEMKTKMFW